MANVRIYELAKELEMSNSDVISALAELGVQVKSHSSTVDAETAGRLKEIINNNGGSAVAEKPEITLPAEITVRQLAELLDVPTAEIQKALVKQGALVAVNQIISPDLARKATESLGYTIAEPEIAPEEPEEAPVEEPSGEVEPAQAATAVKEPSKPKSPVVPKRKRAIPREAVLVPRPPVVTILGHVDHGKTTLLDTIRKTSVVDREFGGITQHIGAYQVEVKGKKITFLDTPGHEAFTAMRARGAQVTDIAVLIIAADDGVMPQTIEALDHARAAEVDIIIAINKIDKPNANPDRLKQQLTEHNVVIEEWGGDTVAVGISALSGEHVDELLDMILLVAELAELKADPQGPVEGTVVEAKLDRGQGPVATVLVESGTLKHGDVIVVGQTYGRIKAMLDDRGHRIKKAGPSTPVEIVGLSSVPQAGEGLEIAKNEREARQVAEARTEEERSEKFASTQRVTLADLYKQLQEGVVKELNLILKADVQGSVEAITQALEQTGTEEVRVNLIHSGVGNIGESDILLASASNAVVFGFNVKIDNPGKQAAETERIDVHTYNVIYELLDDVKAAMEGLLEPEIREKVIGHAEIRQLFRLPRAGNIAGCYVTDGKIQRNAEIRVLRDGEVLHSGKISSLKHVKEDVREIAESYECGIMVEGFNDFREGDILEGFVREEIARRI